MKLQVLTYHRTEPDPDPRKLHLVSDAEFAWQVRVIRESGIPVLNLQDIALVDSGAMRLALTFDDGFLSDLRNAEILQANGFTATFFVSTALVGTGDYMDWAQVRRLLALGMSVGSHSHHHVRLTTLPPEYAAENLVMSRRLLEEALGVPVTAIAFPGGDRDDGVLAAARQAGYCQLYTTRRGANRLPSGTVEGILRRNNVIRGMSREDFSALLFDRPSLRNRVVHGLAASARAVLPDKGYNAVRALAARIRNR